MPDRARREPLVGLLWHTTVVLVLLTIGYFMLPLRSPWGDATTAGRLAGSVLAWGVLLVFLRNAARRSQDRQPPEYHRVQELLTALYLLVLGFALLYAIIAAAAPEQFSGLANRSDALYFSVTTTATVGFGDIHAAGTPARLLVTVQMLFNLIYIGTALRILSSGISFPKRDRG
jgi:voltage-gated potassium channel